MSKAILVLNEMPLSCYECPLHNYHFCDVNGDPIDYDVRPSHCMLKELPEKHEIDRSKCSDPFYEFEFEYGYNQCIDEIIGG